MTEALPQVPLTRPQIAVLRSLLVNKPTHRRSPGLAGQLAKQFGIGRVDKHDPAYITYSAADFLRAEVALTSGGFSLEVPTSAPKRAPVRQADQDCVAVAPINMSGLQLPGARCATLAGRDAISLDYQVILACEKFEMLLCLDQFGWLENFIRGRRTLAIFLGSVAPYRKPAANHLIKQSTAPVLGFFDFDPCGLKRAANLPRLEALCLPEWQDLEQALRRKNKNTDYRREMAQHRSGLDAVDCHVISPAWARMKRMQRCLDHDAFPR